jgi:hypothetical protein
VIPLLVRHGVLNPEAARAAEQIKGLLRRDAASEFEQAEFDTLKLAFAQMSDGSPGKTGAPKS